MKKLNLNEEILSIKWTLKDIKNLFNHNGIDFTQENIDKYLSQGLLNDVSDFSVDKGWEKLEQNIFDIIVKNEEKLGNDNYSLRMSKRTIANISIEKIQEEIESNGGEIGKFLSRNEGKIINYILDELQSNGIVDINCKIKEYFWDYKKAYTNAIEDIVSSIMPDIEEFLFEDLSDDEADKLMSHIFSQENFALEPHEECIEVNEIHHPILVKLDGKPYATMGVSKAVTFEELESIIDKHIQRNRIFDYSIYVREVNSDKKFRSFMLGESWYHSIDDFSEDLVLYKSLFDDTAVLGKEESDFLSEYSL